MKQSDKQESIAEIFDRLCEISLKMDVRARADFFEFLSVFSSDQFERARREMNRKDFCLAENQKSK